MVDEKPLAQKRDFYSVRRRAVMEIITALNEGQSRNQIYLNIALRYGYGEKFVDRMIELNMSNEEAKND